MATETINNQTPINNTIQVMVPPGDETGLYYIPLANLPWQTSWQQLKDHVRTVCSSVERVEVFNESTSGWVSVRGRENYEAALELLNTKIFNGRPTFAADKNGDQEIPIKKLVGPSAEANASSPRSPRTPRTTPPSMQYPTNTPPIMSPSLDYNQWASSATPGSLLSSPATDFGPAPSHGRMSQYSDTASWPPMHDSSYMDAFSTMPMAMPQYASDGYPYQHQYVQSGEYGEVEYYPSMQYAVQNPGPVDLGETDYPNYFQGTVQSSRWAQPGSSDGNAGAYVETMRSKVIIKGLPTGSKAEQIQNLIRSKAGSDADKIHHINLVPAQKGGKRGTATVIFHTAEAADKLVNKLKGYKMDGKTLDIELTKEGVSENELGRGKHSKHHREEREKKETPKASSAAPKDDKKDKSHTKRGVVIANGSSKKASENSKKASENSKKH